MWTFAKSYGMKENNDLLKEFLGKLKENC